jgi:hypothetical protein
LERKSENLNLHVAAKAPRTPGKHNQIHSRTECTENTEEGFLTLSRRDGEAKVFVTGFKPRMTAFALDYRSSLPLSASALK